MADIEAREVAREVYAAFLETAPHSAFQRLAWLDIVEQVYKVRVLLLGYFRDAELCAVSPVMGRRIGPFRIWGAPLRKCGTPPVTPFCAPAALAVDLVPILHQWVRNRRIRYMQFALPARAGISSEADGMEPLNNLELNLNRPLESIWQSISQQRTAVRKAVRAGVRLGWRYGPALIETQRALLRATYGRQGTGLRPNFPLALYRRLLEARQSTGLRVLCATYDGKVIGATWIFSDAEKCYYWDAATLDEARDLNANHLLVWTLIRWAHRRGFATLDFVGPVSGGRGGSRPGIGRFKQTMGAHAVDYELVYWYSPLMHAALAGYRLLNRLRSHGLRKAKEGSAH
jgi:hypothetical protein